MKKIVWSQFIILLCGTLFAWTNFGIELAGWLEQGSCATGCAIGAANPFFTACFFGALFFTAAFVLSVIMLKKDGG